MPGRTARPVSLLSTGRVALIVFFFLEQVGNGAQFFGCTLELSDLFSQNFQLRLLAT